MKRFGMKARRGASVLWLVFAPLMALTFASSQAFALPDLTIYGPAVQPSVTTRAFSSSDCEVVEGCAVPGVRRLLSFTSEIRNIGDQNLELGDPAGNPLFVWASCHAHYHFEDFAVYRLLNSSGGLVVTGRKMAFCLEDTYRWRAGAPSTRRYSCSTGQGIQAGWADVYDRAVPCQWLDITGLPGGDYILELVLDPNNHFTEADKANNITRVTVNLPSDCVAPPNDNFANAQLLPGVNTSGVGDNACATKEPGEPNHAGDAGGHSVWYRWVAPYNGTVTINTIGSDFDTLLAVYRGSSVGSLTLVAQNDDIVPYTNRVSQLSFTAVSNTTYRIAVDGWGGGDEGIGGVRLNINPPPNDAFANCITLTGAAGQVTGHNIGATKQAGEPAHAGNIGGHSVWYCWTAPTNGMWVFDTIPSNFDTLLAVYTGTSVNNLTSVVSDDDSGGNFRSRLTLNAVSGRAYRIAVDGSTGATGTIGLRWSSMVRLAIRRLPGGAMELTINGAPGVYQVHASTNLTNWLTIATLTTTTTTHRYTNSPANLRSRFFRVRRQ
jgi:hypothetical protein